MVPNCLERWCMEANEATQTHYNNPIAPTYPVWAYYVHGRQRRCQEDPVSPPPADCRRQLGRPRITWLSTVQQDLKQHHLTLPKAADLAQNRHLWRMMSTYGAMQSQSCQPETTTMTTCVWHEGPTPCEDTKFRSKLRASINSHLAVVCMLNAWLLACSCAAIWRMSLQHTDFAKFPWPSHIPCSTVRTLIYINFFTDSSDELIWVCAQQFGRILELVFCRLNVFLCETTSVKLLHFYIWYHSY